MATIMMFKNNSNAKKMLASCLKCLEDNPLLFTDHYNKNDQESCFIENRHDQSVLSLNRKIHGSVIINDETEGVIIMRSLMWRLACETINCSSYKFSNLIIITKYDM